MSGTSKSLMYAIICITVSLYNCPANMITISIQIFASTFSLLSIVGTKIKMHIKPCRLLSVVNFWSLTSK